MLGGGGSGAGNPAGGSNPAGISSNLNYIGTRVYGYSGMLALSSGSDATMLEFTTGTEIIHCNIQFTFDYDLLENGKFFGVELEMDGQTVLKPRAEQRISGSGHGTDLISVIELIIPSFTTVKIIGQTDDGGTECGCALVGKIL